MADNALSLAPDQYFGSTFHGRAALQWVHPSPIKPPDDLIAGGF
jgi:hypothetical protein